MAANADCEIFRRKLHDVGVDERGRVVGLERVPACGIEIHAHDHVYAGPPEALREAPHAAEEIDRGDLSCRRLAHQAAFSWRNDLVSR